MLCPIKVNCDTIELIMHTSCYFILDLLLVKLIGVNKGRHVTLKYFNILIKVSRKHILCEYPRAGCLRG